MGLIVKTNDVEKTHDTVQIKKVVRTKSKNSLEKYEEISNHIIKSKIMSDWSFNMITEITFNHN